MPVILYLPGNTRILLGFNYKTSQGKVEIIGKNLDFIGTGMDDVKYARQYQDFIGM